jgi:hypothetical protein
MSASLSTSGVAWSNGRRKLDLVGPVSLDFLHDRFHLNPTLVGAPSAPRVRVMLRPWLVLPRSVLASAVAGRGDQRERGERDAEPEHGASGTRF